MTVDATIAAPPGGRELQRRLWTAVALIPLFLVAVAVGRIVFLGAVMLLAGVASWEFLRMASRKGFRPRVVSGVGLAVALPAAFYLAPGHPAGVAALVALGVVGVAAAQLLDREGEEATAAVATTVYGALYTGLLLAHFILIREVPRSVPGMSYWSGALLVALPVVLTWVNDTTAYFVGRRWGRRKLLPRVSPGKTVEGAVGALAGTIVAAIAGVWLVDLWVPLFDRVDGLVIGALVGIAAPLGDLVESAFKRDAGVKDASELVPGHGGVLDRFDSLMLVAPAFWYWFRAAAL